MHIRIGSRGSKLALWQSEYVATKLKEAYPNITYEIIVIKTKGDQIQNISLQKIGDKGLFVKEIEEQLLAGKIDMAVHSMKDMPSILPESLVFSKTLKREDTRDVLILKEADSLAALKKNAIIGTGSVRRAKQLKKLRDDLIIKDIRGNVDTRLRKLYDEEYDGIVMAAAGLKRMGLEDKITQYLTYEQMVPACAQGALAIELKENQTELLRMLNSLADTESDLCVKAERTYLQALQGNCHIPVGGYCKKEKENYSFHAVYSKDVDTKLAIYHESGKDPIQLALDAANYVKEEMEKTHES